MRFFVLLALVAPSFALADLVPADVRRELEALADLMPDGLRKCSAGENLKIKGETLQLDKDDKRWAIVTTGACDLILEDVVIEGPHGIFLTGATDLTLRNVTFRVAGTAISASGSSDVKMFNVTIDSKDGSSIIATGASEVVIKKSTLVVDRAFNFSGTAELSVDEETLVNGKPYRAIKKRKYKRKARGVFP